MSRLSFFKSNFFKDFVFFLNAIIHYFTTDLEPWNRKLLEFGEKFSIVEEA